MRFKNSIAFCSATFLALGLAGPAAVAEPADEYSSPPEATTQLAAKNSVVLAQRPTRTGFVRPFAGAPKYLSLAPKKVRKSAQLHRAIGQRRADRIARGIGLRKKNVFTTKQYRQFISGRGIGGQKSAARLVDSSVRILTNTQGRPLRYREDGRVVKTVLASYGLMVNKDGQLQSPANADAPTRKINVLLEPGGYLGTWCQANGAKKALRQLYRSAYTVEAVYGNRAQQRSGEAQLVSNRKYASPKTTVGMSMAPALWLVNFALIYTLNPEKAAKMPGRWAPIPREVARAIKRSPTGQVSYQRFANLLD